jgi:antitoxin (DNA-binding transcriptional repressor) of toxin-antitoxin stability system
MDNIIGLKDLRENVDRYIANVSKGQSFLVVRKSKPVFKISAPDVDNVWKTSYENLIENIKFLSSNKSLDFLKKEPDLYENY